MPRPRRPRSAPSPKATGPALRISTKGFLRGIMFRAAVSIVLLVAGSIPAGWALSAPPDLPALTREAGLIVRARVTQLTSVQGETTVHLRVRRVLKGRAERRIQVRVPGGNLNETTAVGVSGQPEFQPGDEVL